MPRLLLIILLATTCSLAPAGAQEKKARTIQGWGEVVDPAGDCKIAADNGRLTITVPGTQHNLNPLPGWNNMLAPRVLQPVEGDFTAVVKARVFKRPEANTSTNKEKPHSFVAGGLVIWQDAKNYLRCMRAANGERGDVFISIEGFADGQMITSGGAPLDDQDTYLRVQRKNGRLTYATSSDGQKWQDRRPPGKALTLAAKVQVGVAVVNATNREITHEFEGLQVGKR